MAHELITSPLVVGTSITQIFRVVNMNPGRYHMKMDLAGIPVGGPVTTLTAAFTGSVDLVQFNLARWLATGVLDASAHTAFGTSAGSNWVYAKMFGLLSVTAPGDLVISCTRTGGTSHTIQPGSLFETIS